MKVAGREVEISLGGLNFWLNKTFFQTHETFLCSIFSKKKMHLATRILWFAFFFLSLILGCQTLSIKDLYMGEGRAECVVYNLAHAIRPQLKRNLIKFLIRGLPTRDKLAHFTNQNSSCQLCH